MKRVLLLMFIASSVLAQSANVIELEAPDTARVKSAYEALQKAQADWDKVQKEIEQKYAQVKVGDPTGTTNVPRSLLTFEMSGIACADGTESCFTPQEKKERQEERDKDDAERRIWRSGFEHGFEFSKDFRFIVPKSGGVTMPPQTYYCNPNSAINFNGCVTW